MFFLGFRSLLLYFCYLLCLKLNGKIANLNKAMGVERSGGTGGRVPRSRKISGGRPPQKLRYFSIFFLHMYANCALSNIFKINWPKSKEILNFWGR